MIELGLLAVASLAVLATLLSRTARLRYLPVPVRGNRPRRGSRKFN